MTLSKEKIDYLRKVGKTEAEIDLLIIESDDDSKSIEGLIFKSGDDEELSTYEQIFGKEITEQPSIVDALQDVQHYELRAVAEDYASDVVSMMTEGTLTRDELDRKREPLDRVLEKEIRPQSMDEVAASIETCTIVGLIQALAIEVESMASFGPVLKMDVKKKIRELDKHLLKM